MKYLSLSFLACVFLSPLLAQNNLRQLLREDRGISKQLVLFSESQQKAFNPAQARSAFELDPNSDLAIVNTETDKLGFTHYRYAQTYKSIPVENAMYIVHTQRGLLKAAGGSIVTDFTASQAQLRTAAGLSPQQAVDAALQWVHAQKWAWQDAAFEQDLKEEKGPRASYYPVATKVWYGGQQEINPAQLKLAYKVDVYSLQPLARKWIFVDAQTGQVLGEKAILLSVDETSAVTTVFSGAQTLHSDNTGTSYRLRDYTKGNGIVTLNGANGNVDYTSPSSSWSSLQGKDRYALDAHYGVGATWTFYFNNFNRNSVDNHGILLRSYVNDVTVATSNGGSSANAYWDGNSMRYGYLSNGAGLTAIDITGHELTHGVTQYTSQLSYTAEPGAINESMSDIMGKSVQFYTKPGDVNWQISNDVPWIIRDMANPNARSQPDTYGGAYWVNTTGCSSTQYNDYCGVHTNSGVGNFMFYLLVTGGSGQNDLGNSYTVSAIGLAKADQILYRTNTTYLNPTSKYADWRTACIQAATDLYGASSNEVAQVMNAWYAVGVGAAATSCSAPTGLAANSVTSNAAVLSWTAVGGVQGYTLQWKPAAGSSWTTVTGITAQSYTLNGLVAGTAYTFQVATVCTSGTSTYSSPVGFTTATSSTGGLTYKYYEGSWNSLPDFNTLTPVKTGTSANVDINERTAGRADNYAFVWQGYITIPTAGTYTFETVSDDGSKLYFNTLYNPAANATVNNDGLHAPVSATGTVNVLAAGTYPISITFFEKDGGEQMQVYWTGPNFARQAIPNSAFSTTAPTATGGLTYKYYEGSWDALPNFNNLTPVKTGTTDNADISVRTPGRNDSFAFVWQGYITITTPGMYTFETVSDDGSRIYFNTLYDPAATPVANNDGLHAPTSASGIVNIAAAGVYPICITYFEKDGGEQMQVYWAGPNIARQPVPNSVLSTTQPPPSNGLSYKYYEGAWTSLPNFNTLNPVKTGNSANVDLSQRTPGRNDQYAFLWQGYINIPAPGIYTFETISDDGSKLYFNSLYNPAATATVNNDGVHAPISATGTVNIPAAGLYPISISFFENSEGEQMQVYWTGPNISRQLIPNSAFRVYSSLDAQPQVWQSIGGTTPDAAKLQVGKIYPNPFAESISIDFYNNSPTNDISAGVYDVNGRLVYQYHPGKLAPGSNKLQLDLGSSHLADGYYIVKVNVNGAPVKTVKMVKAKR
ncbi:MAG: M4 family metallopeptidase [Williamsia sp.]|nr:M4 family metallopeptidase [Williamsia sp.]